MIQKNYIPVLLEWGKPVKDAQAIHAGKMIFHDLSRGKSILQAVQRARFDLLKKFAHAPEPAWPLLRISCNGRSLNAMVNENQRWKPNPQRIKHVYLKNSRVMVLAEGFVGRRRRLQTGLRALKQDAGKVGLLVLGTGGLGKSCLAGKLCQRFPDHTLIVTHGKLNAITLQTALTDAFIQAQDQKGQEIIALKESMVEKLTLLGAGSFKEKQYLFLLDDFEQNLTDAGKGCPGPLLPEAADLMEVLLNNLPNGNKNTQMIVTSRYNFSFVRQGCDPIAEHLQKIWLTGFRRAEKNKKARTLENIINYPHQAHLPHLLDAGRGNPRLMEWIDVLVGQMEENEVKSLSSMIKAKEEEFIRHHLIGELLQRGGQELERLLRNLSIYRLPVQLEGVKKIAAKAGLSRWQGLLGEGMNLSLIEHDQTRGAYRLTPLLRDQLSRELGNAPLLHKAAFSYYKNICNTRWITAPLFHGKDILLTVMKAAASNHLDIPYPDYDRRQKKLDSLDPILVEETIYHALGCSEEPMASRLAVNLMYHLFEKLALQESLRVGLWLLAEKNGNAPGRKTHFFKFTGLYA